MTQDPMENTVMPSMVWEVADFFVTRHAPAAELAWVYDPNVKILIEGAFQPWSVFLNQTRNSIEHRGYPRGVERSALMVILSLIPDFGGSLSENFTRRLSSLFDICGEYLDTTTERLVCDRIFGFSLRKIIKGNLFRALLDDAIEDSLSLDQWQLKAKLFLELAGVQDWKNRTLWNEGLFTRIGWPDVIQDNAYPTVSKSPIRPDLLTSLCLLGKMDHVRCLIDMGYDLSHFLLFNFQKKFWQQAGEKPKTLADVHPCCLQALDWIEDNRGKNTDCSILEGWEMFVWQMINEGQDKDRNNDLTGDEYNALLVLKVLSNECKLGEHVQEVVDAANAYINAFPGLGLPDYIPELDD